MFLTSPFGSHHVFFYYYQYNDHRQAIDYDCVPFEIPTGVLAKKIHLPSMATFCISPTAVTCGCNPAERDEGIRKCE